MAQRHNPDDFNPTTQASEYNAAARRQEVKSWLSGLHTSGDDTGYDRAAQGLKIERRTTS